MKKKIFLISILSVILVCLILIIISIYNNNDNKIDEHIHTYSEEWSYDDTNHWHNAICEHNDLISSLEAHVDSNEVIINPATDDTVGLGQYTCSVCNYTYTKEILISVKINELPVITNNIIYTGQSLNNILLANGSGSVEGHFEWENSDLIITESGEYNVIFVPNESDKYATITTTIYIEAIDLFVDVKCGDNGSASLLGTNKVNYNSSFEVSFIPDNGYMISDVIVDGISVGVCSSYRIDNIIENHCIEVLYVEKPVSSNLSFVITCLEGSADCYQINDETVLFTSLSMDSIYSISGELNGNIIIDIGEEYNFDLEFHGFTLNSSDVNPITILSGNNVSLVAKKGYENYIYDNRDVIDPTDESLYSAAIYSLVDLDICGKGSLILESENNNGIHSKDDLEVKNLNLSIKASDNTLKGNDSVTISNCNTNLISKAGDCVKTTNSDISDKGNQRGNITITGGTHNLYAATDGLDAAYNVIIDDETTILNIYTDKYSQYSEEITATSNTVNYVRFNSNQYNYSIKYFNSDTDFEWVNCEYYTSVASGRGTYYYYKYDKKTNYSKMSLYMYDSSQTQGQDENYYYSSQNLTTNDAYDTLALSNRMGSLSVSFTNYTTQSQGGMGGMQEGNTDKGDYSTKGIKASNEIVINKGTIHIEAYDDAIHANNDVVLENGATPLGNVTINGGNINISSNDDGIHADGVLTITAGNIGISNSYEGLEGSSIVISGGNTSVIAKDDGANSTITSGNGITVNGGTLYIYCGGDGLDANTQTSYSGIIFNGGNTVVISTSNGNSALDSEKGYTYNSGNVIAIMPTGGMSSESTNCSNFSSIATSSNISLSSGNYFTVSVSGNIKAVVKMPTSISSIVIYLGSNQANLSSSTSNTNELDGNGVYWN